MFYLILSVTILLLALAFTMIGLHYVEYFYEKGQTKKFVLCIIGLLAMISITFFTIIELKKAARRDMENEIKEAFTITCQDGYIYTTILDGDSKLFIDSDGNPIACTDNTNK